MQSTANKTFVLALFGCIAAMYLGNKLLPVVGYYLPGIVYLGLFGLVVLFAFGVGISRVQFQCWLMLLPVFSVSILNVILYWFSGNFADGFFQLYGEAQIYVYALIAAVILSKANEKQTRRIFFALLIIYAFTAVTTYIGCNKYDGASRELATLGTSDYRYQLLVRENIGGFSFTYELVLLTPLVIYLLRTKKISNFLGTVVLILFGMAVIRTEYATAVLLFLCCLTLLVIPKLTPRKMLVIAVLLLVILILGGAILGELFTFLSDVFQSATLKGRFSELADMFLRDDTESGNLGNRMDLYKKSINAFFESAALGTWGKRISGGHSFILDTMAIFGIVGVGALFIMYHTLYSNCIKPYKGYEFYPYLQFVYIMALCLAVINPKPFLFIFIFVFALFVRTAMCKSIKE